MVSCVTLFLILVHFLVPMDDIIYFWLKGFSGLLTTLSPFVFYKGSKRFGTLVSRYDIAIGVGCSLIHPRYCQTLHLTSFILLVTKFQPHLAEI